jgi:hypothetical protein
MCWVARLPAELDLATGFERNLRICPAESDDVTILLFRFPPEALDQFTQNEFNAAPPIVWNRFPGAADDSDLLVLRTNAPALTWFAGLVKVGFELIFFLNHQHGFGDRNRASVISFFPDNGRYRC